MPGMTVTEKILAKHGHKSRVSPGENVWIDVDVLMTHDICGPGTIGIFYEKFGRQAKVWSKDKVVIIPDHYIFTADQTCHRNIQTLRDFVKEQGLKYYYDPEFVTSEPGMPNPYKDPTKTNYKGVCHKALPEEGHIRPGEVLIGTDSHTCTAGAFGQFATGVGNTDAAFVLGTGKTWVKIPPTMKFTFHGQIPPVPDREGLILAVIGEIGVDGATYRSMHFAGDGISSLTLEDRMTLTNMAIEAGGKNGICDVDEKTLRYVRKLAATCRIGKCSPTTKTRNISPSARVGSERALEPLVAKPHSPDNKDTAYNCRDVKLDRAYIGSCTGGKITDMMFAANILKGNQVKIPTFVVPRQHGSACRHEAAQPPRRRKRPERKVDRRHPPRRRRDGRPQRLQRLPRRPERHVRPPQRHRDVHQHDQPQLPGPHGQQKVSRLSCQPANGRRQRAHRFRHRPARVRESADRDRHGRCDVKASLRPSDPSCISPRPRGGFFVDHTPRSVTQRFIYLCGASRQRRQTA